MTSEKRNAKVARFHKFKNFNVGILIFGIIFIYMIATVIMYITTPRITIYEVRQGSILKDNAYTGLAIRDETVVLTEDSGYINYYAEDSSKVRIGTKIYTLSKDKLEFSESTTGSEVELTTEERNSMIRNIQSFNNQFHTDNFSSVYQLKGELKNSLNKIANHGKANQLDTIIASGIYDDLSVKTASKDGIIICSVDGMEDLTLETITSDHLKKINYKKTEFSNNAEVQSGEPIYKIITSDKWNLLLEINDETKTALAEKTTIKVNFKKDNQELRANVSFLEIEGSSILCLSFDHSMVRYASERYLDIELILEDETGLKIPKSAETSKDFYVVPNTYLTLGGNSSNDGVMRQRKDSDGKVINEFIPVTVYYEEEEMIYLDPNIFEEGDILLKPDSSETYPLTETRALKGVYNINKGYAVFKQIKILCDSDDYYIVEEGNSFGLSNYDHIALDSTNIKENDVVF